MKKFLLIISAALLLACTPNPEEYKTSVPVTPKVPQVANGGSAESETENEAEKETEKKPAELPSQVNLDVPFYPQAPDGNWDDPWQEACEESSITLAYYYKKGLPLSKDLFRQKILDLVDWQMENFGHWRDTNIEETRTMFRDFYGYEGELEIINNPTVADIKKALANGHPVIAPFAGRLLGNPFFSGAGPYYHMAVIKGYDDENNEFIVNDVGTSRGADFVYSYETVMYALHDWNGTKTNIQGGAKKILIVR